METRTDVGILKDIYEAERRADRVVRDAEAEAEALIEEAGAAARAEEALRREALARRYGEALNAQRAEIEGEIRGFLKDREAETDRWAGRRRAEIDRIVDRLIAMVLPP